MWASKDNNLDAIKALILGLGGADVNLSNNYGDTALIKAIENGYREAAKKLLHLGDFNVLEGKCTEFITAAQKASIKTISELIDNG
jgi:ankyrin repeat protein